MNLADLKAARANREIVNTPKGAARITQIGDHEPVCWLRSVEHNGLTFCAKHEDITRRPDQTVPQRKRIKVPQIT